MTKSVERLKPPFLNKYDECQDINQDFIKIGQLIKLSVITQFFPPDYAPTGQLIEELVMHLDKQGVDVEVFTGRLCF